MYVLLHVGYAIHIVVVASGIDSIRCMYHRITHKNSRVLREYWKTFRSVRVSVVTIAVVVFAVVSGAVSSWVCVNRIFDGIVGKQSVGR